MLFNSFEYLLFLPTVLVIYYALGHRAQNIFLLLASYLFYGLWDWRFLLLLLFTTVLDFAVALRIDAAPLGSKLRKRWLLVSLCSNLGVLATFKYFGFFSHSLAELLRALGLQASFPVIHLVLPVGVSFYTFQSISYTVDVYRGKLPAAARLSEFALYVAFFPQLVAGPIERAPHMLPLIRAPRRVDMGTLSSGLGLILLGLFRKLCIADAVSAEVSAAFSEPGQLTGPQLLRGAYVFALQIYGDFAGYSDIARGSARLLGFDMMLNFNQPYLSQNITEFWRRWHISLSSWLRDYLYIPLGGNRHGPLKTYRNLFLTMLLGGLWHGANWTFVVWGGLHGAYLAAHKLWAGFFERTGADHRSRARRWLTGFAGAFVTVHLVVLAWIFFRAESIDKALLYLSLMPHGWSFRGLSVLGLPALFLALTLLVDIPQYLFRDHDVIERLPLAGRALAYFAILALVFLLGGAQNATFIYFQF
jgi:alginate O-acetyltransferase complex protein AlgI